MRGNSGKNKLFSVDENVFIEQAEYISEKEMLQWGQAHPQERMFLKKLSSAGAKLIVGPRGCGKTTLLLKSYAAMRRGGSSVFPVYVNFKTSLKLEPLYKSNVNASYWFTLWLILKVYEGIYKTFDAKKLHNQIPNLARTTVAKLVSDLEQGRTSAIDTANLQLSVNRLQDDLNGIIENLELSRVVLLLDDAAHAFSFAQQRGFFDFFRQIKSRSISPKAAIYPGVTSYSATFQAGHDAEEIDVWLKPDDQNYLPFMRDLVAKRLPAQAIDMLLANKPVFELVCFCAYGIPRALLNMLHEVLSNSESETAKFNLRTAQDVIRRSLETTLSVYRSLKQKLPVYGNFIDTGDVLLRSADKLIKEYNKDKEIGRKSVSIAVSAPLSVELVKTLGFLEYAGLVVPKGTVSRGVKGSFHLFGIHYAYLTSNNSIVPVKSPNVIDIVCALRTRNAHEFTRVSAGKLIDDRNPVSAFALMLPPCQSCGSARSNDEAKFCHHCGAPLKNHSIFEQLVSHSIGVLPLTEGRISTIKQHSNIRAVRDILLDHDHKALRSVPQIGPHWANKIMSYAEEYIA